MLNFAQLKCWHQPAPYLVSINTEYDSEINKMADRYAQRSRRAVKLKNVMSFRLYNYGLRPRLKKRLNLLASADR